MVQTVEEGSPVMMRGNYGRARMVVEKLRGEPRRSGGERAKRFAVIESYY